MGPHIVVPISKAVMKTTIEISDSLLRDARHLARREGVTLRALVERGLHHVVAESSSGPSFKLRHASFKGKGLQAEFAEATWEQVRATAYQGRGG
jgi:thiamine monophosphate kinase